MAIRIKKIIINIVLVLLLAILMAVIILPFAAEQQFKRAKKLEREYRWKMAEEKYQIAAALNPRDSKYPAATGAFLMRQGSSRKDNFLYLRAKKLFKRACELNPWHAEHRYQLGKACLALSDVKGAVSNFRKAIEMDQYNFRNNYLIGYDMLPVWNEIDNSEKTFALDRFKFVLKERPWYGSFIYPAVFKTVQDFNSAEEITSKTLAGYRSLYSFVCKSSLWQYRKPVKTSFLYYRQKENPEKFRQEKLTRLKLIDKITEEGLKSVHSYIEETHEQNNGTNITELKKFAAWTDWQREPPEEVSARESGNMYRDGTVYRAVMLPKGRAVIRIQARGDDAFNIWPYMIVELDGEEIGEKFVNSKKWESYSFEVDTKGGIKVLGVSFVNDDSDSKKGIDRNLYIGDITIQESRFTPTVLVPKTKRGDHTP